MIGMNKDFVDPYFRYVFFLKIVSLLREFICTLFFFMIIGLFVFKASFSYLCIK